MKVCIATLFGMHRGTGGIQAHPRWLMQYLKEQGIDYVYISPYDYSAVLVYPVFAARVLLKNFSRFLSAYWFRKWHYYFLKKALIRLFSRRHFDVVNAQGPLAALAALEVRQRYGQRYQVVLTVHMNWPSQAEEEALAGNIRRGGRYYKEIKKMEKEVFLTVDKIAVVSNYMKAALLREYPGLNGGLIEVIYNGIASDFASGARLPESDREAGNFRLINVGALSWRKNQQFLLWVMLELIKNFPGLQLELVGNGDCRSALGRLASSLGVRENIVFRGYQPDVRPYLRRSQVYLHSSLGESCPYVLIEAMSFGLPVIAFSVGGTPELIKHGFNGFLAEDKNVETYARYVETLLLDQAKYAAMRANCLKMFQEKFDYRLMGENFVEFYKREIPDKKI